MRFSFRVDVEVEKREGKFATRDDISGQILEALEQADPGSLQGDNGGEYEITSFEVMEVSEVKIKGKKHEEKEA